MAHYTVAVISKDLKDVENLLLPYAIYNLGDAKEITYTRNEVVSRSRDKLEEFNKFIYSRYLIDKEKFIIENKYYPGFLEYVEKGFTEDFKKSDTEIYEDIINHELSLERKIDGSISLDYNPDGKFTWYALEKTPYTLWDFKCEGGKIVRDYKGKVKDLAINRKSSQEEISELLDYWDRIINHPKKIRESLDLDNATQEELEQYKMCCDKKDVLIDMYSNFENFLEYKNKLQSFAVITPDGKWHENVLRDWFGNISYSIESQKEWVDNYCERFIEPYGEYFITFVEVSEY